MPIAPPPEDSVALDEIVRQVALYKTAKVEIKRWEEIATAARSAIVDALGEHEIGTLRGQVVMSYKSIKSTRLDQTLVRGQFPDVFRACQTESTSRRLDIVEPSE